MAFAFKKLKRSKTELLSEHLAHPRPFYRRCGDRHVVVE